MFMKVERKEMTERKQVRIKNLLKYLHFRKTVYSAYDNNNNNDNPYISQ